MTPRLRTLLFITATALGLPIEVIAQTVNVEAAWARSTVAGQQAGGVFAKLSSDRAVSLVGASSPAAERMEIHEMALEQGVMRMRPLTTLKLPAGKTVELKPGGHHLMLMGLKKPLEAGQTLPITLSFQGENNKTFTLDVKVSVRPAAGYSPPHAHH